MSLYIKFTPPSETILDVMFGTTEEDDDDVCLRVRWVHRNDTLFKIIIINIRTRRVQTIIVVLL